MDSGLPGTPDLRSSVRDMPRFWAALERGRDGRCLRGRQHSVRLQHCCCWRRRRVLTVLPMNQPPLQPLRIPRNWQVTYNDFRQVDFCEDTAAYFREDLLQARCAQTNVLIDLGWYPDGDPGGRFVVYAFSGDFHGKQLLRAEAASRDEAVAILEDAFLRYISHCPE